MHFTLHAAPFYAFLLADVGTVNIELLTDTVFIDKGLTEIPDGF